MEITCEIVAHFGTSHMPTSQSVEQGVGAPHRKLGWIMLISSCGPTKACKSLTEYNPAVDLDAGLKDTGQNQVFSSPN
jgi:hypothetical protein